MGGETPETLSAEISEGRWLIVADTLDAPGHPPPRPLLRWLDFLTAVAQRKRLVGLGTSLFALVGLLLALILPNRYTATTQLLPPQGSPSAVSAVLGQFGELASLAGRDMLRNPSALFVVLLRSRTIADRLIFRFDLAKVYAKKRASDCRVVLESHTQIESSKEGVIVIRVDDQDPGRAAGLANGYVEELVRMNEKLAVGEAARRRLFFEGQLEQASGQLANAEDALKRAQETSGVIQLDTQAKALLESIAALRVRIIAKEVQLREARTYGGDQHPDVVRTEQELAVLRQELARLQQQGGGAPAEVGASRLPSAGLEYVRRLREVKYREAVFEMLAKQLEAARIDEAKEGALIQVLDPAVVPERKSGPDRLLLVAMAALSGLLLTLSWVAVTGWVGHLAADPVDGPRLLRLKECSRLSHANSGSNPQF
jgi:uncharacterized protein involved in exopolysaccharide biosynthesis